MQKNTSKLTFEVFLKNYVKSLSLDNTLSMKKLIKEASSTNLRLIEPLILYIRFNQLDDTYAKFKNNDLLNVELNQFKLKYPDKVLLMDDFEKQLVENGFQKVYNSFIYFKNKKANEVLLKEKMIIKISELIQSNKVSMYRLSKDLQINPGNLNSYLKHHKFDALSIKKCNDLLNYLVTR